jgi:hypothetical protein
MMVIEKRYSGEGGAATVAELTHLNALPYLLLNVVVAISVLIAADTAAS